MNMNKALLALVCTGLLNACGSDGAQSVNKPTTPEPVVPTSPSTGVEIIDNSIIAYDEESKTGQPIDLFLYFPDNKLSNVQWKQATGTALELIATNSKGLAFTPSGAGDYGFEVTFNIHTSEDAFSTETLTHSVSVSDDNTYIGARFGHVVVEGNKVSLRAELNDSLDKSNLVWQQLSGPSVTFTDEDTQGDLAVFFNAPNVAKDTLIEFQVSASNNTSTYTDTVAVLIEDSTTINSNAYFDERVATVFPFNENSPHKNNLVPCVYSNTLTSSCTLGKLPLIAQETTKPSLEDIMDRVVVSHQWMGERFKIFLKTYDVNNDFKNLLRATTAIVISYDVRPSFYWAATGAIYLDPDNLWLLKSERDTINEAPDYRANFGNELNFALPWRYVKNNEYAYSFVEDDVRTDRTAEDGLYRLTSLIYHELAHANDFFPSSKWATHSSNTRILDAAIDKNTPESNGLSIAYPLRSQEMKNLAQVSFHGESANNTQKSYLPEDVANFFNQDIAPQYYNYSSEREDYAMLFDGLMLKARYGIDRDVAITNAPQGDVIYAKDYIVTWGQRGRIGDESIKARATYVVNRILPEFTEAARFIEDLPVPIAMIVGNNWAQNLTISPVVAAAEALVQSNMQTKINKAASSATGLEQLRVSKIHQFYQKPLPAH
jgi:hypothetical protein